MIKRCLHKIFSGLLALVVLLSTVSFTVEKHYCGDVLIDVSVFSEVKKCGMASMEMLQKKSCCKDEIKVVEGQDKLQFTTFDDLDFNNTQLVFATYIYAYNNLFKSLDKQIIPHKDYSPPNLIVDIQVLDQVFII